MSRINRLLPLLLLLLLAATACSTAPQAAQLPAPHSVSSPAAGSTVAQTAAPDAGRRAAGQQGAVSSANPLASEAGLAMLRAGGNAVDAAVAIAFAIGVVEPHMSGLGGGGAALVWMKDAGRPEYLDFYAAQYAPSFRDHLERRGRGPDLRIVAVPGNVAGLLELHGRWGSLPLARVMAPAIELAEKGFPVGQVLAATIQGDSTKLSRFPESWKRLWPNDKPLQPGEILRNPELAATLRLISEQGKQGFYAGRVAKSLVAALNAGGHPAKLEHLADYKTNWRRPLCIDYRGHTVLSAPPPQTGMQVLHTLELLEPHDLPALGLPTRSATAFDVLTSALRVGMANSGGNSDPAWVAVPAAGVTSEPFARARAGLVGTGRAAQSIPRLDPRRYDKTPPAGDCGRYDPYGAAPVISGVDDAGTGTLVVEPVLPGAVAGDIALDDSADEGGETTHLSVVDRHGNAVALTQTNSTTFGVGAWVEGFYLNDSGFRFNANNIDAPSRSPWRTRTTTISPTVILDKGEVRMVVGAPGAGRIPTAVVQAIVYTLDYGMDPLDAVRMPRIFPTAQRPVVQLEHGFSHEVLGAARAMGYDPVNPAPGYARLYLVARKGDQWIGVADPRHDGEARAY